MCYHYALQAEIPTLEDRFGASFDNPAFGPDDHVQAFTHPALPVVASDSPTRLRLFGWGLIPSWARAEQVADLRRQTPNARAEGIFEKPSFRDAARHRRCLVPATGFFEWKHEGKKKIPYFITTTDGEPFAFGGLWSEWADRQTGKILYTFSIVTTEANPLMAKIHNTKRRMPLILPRQQEAAWLNVRLPQGEVENLLVPFPEEAMRAQQLDQVPG